jgi:superfamily II DNA/RNA helicase
MPAGKTGKGEEVESKASAGDDKKAAAAAAASSSDDISPTSSSTAAVPVNDEELSSLAVSKSITQEVHVCATHKKPRLLIKFVLARRKEEKESKVRQPGAMIVFCTKIKTIKFCEDFLRRQEMKGVVTIHGKMPQAQREKAINSFRCGKDNILLATDVAARGLHIKKLKYVVNYDFPGSLEQYCHRIGRTGRQGEAGHAYSLISRNMAPLVGDLILLLQSCEQKIEPNLAALHKEFAEVTAAGGQIEGANEEEGDDDNDDDDDGGEGEAEEG